MGWGEELFCSLLWFILFFLYILNQSYFCSGEESGVGWFVCWLFFFKTAYGYLGVVIIFMMIFSLGNRTKFMLTRK